MNINKAILVGRVTKDIEVSYTPAQVMSVKISLQTIETKEDKNGGEKESKFTHTISFWGKLAEIAKQYVAKDKILYVEGKIGYVKWIDKETQKERSRVEIIGQQLRLL